MSEAFDKGRDYERKISKITSKKLNFHVKRDSKSGGGSTHKADIRDRYGEIPLFIECKNQATLKLKEWWADADAKSNFGQSPVVVFPYETNSGLEDLACIRYTDLLNLVAEMIDWKETAEDYRTNGIIEQSPIRANDENESVPEPIKQAHEFVEKAKESKSKTSNCRNGHIADNYGYCLQQDCKFSRGYKPPKKKKK